ncbi:MAG: SDR family oxidoreductase, partial [Chloroflexi bacterium]|nr:SDR family oxidoreductase [Chloroflexota bacterium]
MSIASWRRRGPTGDRPDCSTDCRRHRCRAKAWIRSFSLALAAEERARGIGVFTLNPGLLDTALTREMTVVAGYEGRARAFERIARLLAAPPEEAARLALWLAGPATDGRTGVE